MDEHLPPLQEKYGDRLEIRDFELSTPQSYELWRSAMEVYEVPTERRGVPMLFVGDAVLVGSRQIPEQLPILIEEYLAAGGVDFPDLPGLDPALETAATDTPEPSPTPTVKACQDCETQVVPGTEDSVVHVLVFSDRLCEACEEVEEDVLAPLEETYGSRLHVERRDVEGSSDNLDLLRALEEQYGVTRGDMPVIFIGEHALSGAKEAREQLPGLVQTYLDSGGVSLPDVVVTPSPGATASTTPDAPAVHLAYFYQPGCQECDRVQLDLNYLQSKYPQLRVQTFDVTERAPLCEWLGERAGVPERERLTTPAVFLGDEALVGGDLTCQRLEELVSSHTKTGADPVWEDWDPSGGESADSIVERFRSFSLPTVLVAGLVDGLNPCAFATLVFFVSYLAFMGRQGRDALLAGAAFTSGVFLTYLGVGFGVLKFLATLPFLNAASRWIYGFTAAICLVLALGSLHDWWQARNGRMTEMALKMPTRLRRWVNRAIRERAGAGAFVPVTFVTGAVVSIIELACTGQVYLPTILFVLGVPEMRMQAGLYLVLYNLMFILPLVVVFVVVHFGTTSKQLGFLMHRHTAKVKLATAGLFLLLAGWMVVTLV
jgi:cytochrome c biogenesis protein CcdA